MSTLLPILLFAVLQDGANVTKPATDIASADVVVELGAPTEMKPGVRWSPKGATVALAAHGSKVVGSFQLGPKGAAPIQVELHRSEGSERFDILLVDADRDGEFSDAERLTTTPSTRRDKVWSSWSTTLIVPTTNPEGEAIRQNYPVALWHVWDSFEPDAAPALRWSRRGWMEGRALLDGAETVVVIAESRMDGIYDTADSWILAPDREAAFGSSYYRSGSRHAWLGEQAWRIVDLHPSGMRMTLRRHDPGMTRVEEQAADDKYAADKRAPRAEQPVIFGHDYAAALATAKKESKPVLLDFETTWCGPCKQMDAYVYTAQVVVDAAAGVVPIKLDGDVERELVQKYKVAAYPTMILLDAEGKELKRAVGYQSVAEMTAFLSVSSQEG